MVMRESAASCARETAPNTGFRPTWAAMVRRSASGCSVISLRMNELYSPMSEASASRSTVSAERSTGMPVADVMRSSPAETITISSSPMNDTSVISSGSAAMAEATNASPSPRPITMGQSRRAPPSVCGSSARIARNAKWPFIRSQLWRMASCRSTPANRQPSRWATTSASVCDVKVQPWRMSSSRSCS